MSIRQQFNKKTEGLRIDLARLNKELSEKNKSLPLQQFTQQKRKGESPNSNLKRVGVLEEKIHATRIEIDTWELIFQTEERKLKNLDIANRNLTKIPEGVFQLKNLTSLNLSNNKLVYIPPEISKLTQLTLLDLSHNLLATLPPEIAHLDRLNSLNLSSNKITSLPIEIAQISNIRNLEISDNNLTNLPIEIKQFNKLTELHLRGNYIDSLPSEIQEIKWLKILDLRDNNLPILPEVLDKVTEPEKILDYYFSHFSSKKRPINEAKVLVIGQGSVGKTSLIERILYDRFDANQTKTDGIAIKKWDIGEGNNKIKSLLVNWNISSPNPANLTPQPIRLNIWDFGGQEIMHATHQFFLTKRSLYLLVLDARLTQEENRVEYWLKIIQSFGGESPVLIVGNKTDQHPLDIDRTGLSNKYTNIANILETSAFKDTGIDDLKAEIARRVDKLPHVHDLLPETWFEIKTHLELLGKKNNYISQDDYASLCREYSILDELSQRTLIGFLHDLGIILHFQDDQRLEALGILNPQWVTKGVYKILNSHELFQNQGVLTLPLLNSILNLQEYPSNKRLFIVDVMKKFELCYDIEPDKSFLIPDLLPKDEPFIGESEWDGALAFQIHYDVLPSSIISRFIVRMNAFIHKTVWRSGAILKLNRNTALVKSDTEDRKIYIWVNGNNGTRRDLLAIIRGEFQAIHKTLAKIEATEKVPIPNYPKADPVDYILLLQLEQKGVTTHHVQAGNQLIEANVPMLLNGIEPEKVRAEKSIALNISGDIIDSTITIGDSNTITVTKNMFKSIYRTIDESPRKETEKDDLVADIKEIETEVAKGNDVDETFLSRRLRNLKKMAPDIAEVALATLANPAAGVAVIVQKVAKKIKDETK